MDASPLIQVDELHRLLAGPEMGRPVVLDVSFRLGESNGRVDFERAHVPGAAYVDMDTELATIRPDGVGGRHPMPTAAGHLTESGPHTPGVGDFSPSSPGFGRLLDATAAATYAARHVLLDARTADRFRGESETIDSVAGHIPGAISASALDTVDPSGRLLSADQLAERFLERGLEGAAGAARATGATESDGIAEARTVGTYCGSGMQATHLALALSIAGITDEADVYIGSWSDWITDPDRPIAIG